MPYKHHKSVYGNGWYVGASDYDYSKLTKSITGNSPSKYEKAKCLYLWICKNIAYDTTSGIRTADQSYDQRKAVCQGYCELYYRMAESVGLECTLVYGKVKGRKNGGYEDHAWLCVKTEHGNILTDPTWGAGLVINNAFVPSAIPEEWFDVDPKWMILTHLPDKSRNTLLGVGVDEDVFEKFPYCTPLYEKIGVSADAVINETLKGKTMSFPRLIGNVNMHGIDFVDVPKEGVLLKNNSYRFCIKSYGGVEFVIKNGKEIYRREDFIQEGDALYLDIKPSQKGELSVNIVKKNNYFSTERPVIVYLVE